MLSPGGQSKQLVETHMATKGLTHPCPTKYTSWCSAAAAGDHWLATQPLQPQ